jgi:tetratricopeptide (TPR) repeat protein
MAGGWITGLIGGVASGSLGEAAGAILGAARPLYEDAAEEARWHVRAYLSGPPGNHDLERALHAGWLTGALAVLRQHEIALLGDRAPTPGSQRDHYDRLRRGLEMVLELGHPDPAHLEIWHVRDWCHRELERPHALTEADDRTVLGAFEAALSPAFAAPSGADPRIAAARDLAWRRLEEGVGARGVRLPPAFKARFDSEDRQAPGWFGCFFAYVQETLKEDGKVRAAFFARQSAVIRQFVERMDATILRVERKVEEVAGDVARVEGKVEALPDAVTASVMEALRRNGVLREAEKEGLAERTILALARRLKPEETHDLDRAVREVEHAVEIALATIRRGERVGFNEDSLVDGVLAKVARRTRDGAFDRAAQAVDDALAELDTREAEQREAMRRSRATLLEAGIGQEILRRDAAAAARRVEALVALDVPDGRATWAPAFRARWHGFYQEGRDNARNLSLEIAIALAWRMLATAATPDERGVAGNLLGIAFQTLGAREAGAARLEEAVAAYRAALEEFTRERVPLQWAMAQCNLGNALAVFGEREAGTGRLEEAVAAFRAALEERTRERGPFLWAQTIGNLALAEEARGDKAGNAARWRTALGHAEAALAVFQEAGAAFDIEKATRLRERLAAKLGATS